MGGIGGTSGGVVVTGVVGFELAIDACDDRLPLCDRGMRISSVPVVEEDFRLFLADELLECILITSVLRGEGVGGVVPSSTPPSSWPAVFAPAQPNAEAMA